MAIDFLLDYWMIFFCLNKKLLEILYVFMDVVIVGVIVIDLLVQIKHFLLTTKYKKCKDKRIFSLD